MSNLDTPNIIWKPIKLEKQFHYYFDGLQDYTFGPISYIYGGVGEVVLESVGNPVFFVMEADHAHS